jgi:succinoglycan biosynthesis protein ExoA
MDAALFQFYAVGVANDSDASAILRAPAALRASRENVRVSVVVPCRNEIRYIESFLDALRRQDLGEIRMEILIADGMSTDGTRRVLREFARRQPDCRILDNPDGLASTGLNRAIREARGEIIVRMDVHTIYAPDYVRSCVKVLNETHADNVGGPALTFAQGYMARGIACGFHSRFATGGAKFRDARYEGPTSSVPYGCWRKSTLEAIGLFDAGLPRGQDDELNFRIASSGGKIWQSPRIVSWYRPRGSLRALFRQFFQNGLWKVAAIRKHGRPACWRNVVPGACLLVAIFLLIGAGAAALAGFPAWGNELLAVWLALAGVYLVLSLASALAIARREGWLFLPLLPLVFAAYQFPYALGFLCGVFYRPESQLRPNPVHKVLTASTK